MTLTVPDLDPDTDALTAALAYAAAGWYVVPVKRGTKHPGSVLGKGWHTQSTRDPQVIAAWWAGTDHGIALHVGRSGGVVFDVDHPDEVPDVLRQAFVEQAPPRQNTRPSEPRRGHVLFLQPTDRLVGNGNGQLGKAWGEVRGANGVIVVAPSAHPDPDGHYAWHRTGPVPPIPHAIAALLPGPAATHEDAVSDATVEAFLDSCTHNARPALRGVPLQHMTRDIDTGGSRHAAAIEATCWAMREAGAGLYPARPTHDQLRQAFLDAVAQPGKGTHQGDARRGAQAATEWAGIMSFAVAQAMADDSQARREAIEARAPHQDLHGLIAPPRDDAQQPSTTEPPPDDEAMATALEEEAAHNRLVHAEVRTLRVREDARAILARERAGHRPPPDHGTLAEILARPQTAQWRIDRFLPANGRMLLSAQRKTGKTTAMNNLARSLITGDPFLGRFEVEPLEGRVVVLNYEVTGETFARWAHDVGVPSDRMYVINLRGRRNLLADEEGREQLAALIRHQEGQVLLVDPFGRAYTGKSQNDAADVAPWLVRLDEVAEQAGVAELILTAHAGWDGERTRDSSALEDWPDVIATMTRDPDTDTRFIKAEGRDVDLDEDQLHYDATTRRLTLAGTGNRKQVRQANHVEDLAQSVRDLVTATPGMNVSAIRAALRSGDEHFQRGDDSRALALAAERGWIHRVNGPRNSVLHYPGPAVVPSRPDPARGMELSRPDPPLKGGTTHTHTQASVVPGLTQLPGRCRTCSFHIQTQGHQHGCPAKEAS